MKERRKHKRYDVIYRVVYSTEENPARRFRARSFNISMGGIGIRLRRFIRNSRTLKLLIFSPLSGEPVEARGKIVWQSHFHDIAQKRAGIEFTDIQWTKLDSLLKEA